MATNESFDTSSFGVIGGVEVAMMLSRTAVIRAPLAGRWVDRAGTDDLVEVSRFEPVDMPALALSSGETFPGIVRGFVDLVGEMRSGAISSRALSLLGDCRLGLGNASE